MLGLTYSIDTSLTHAEVKPGMISTVDLRYIRDINNESDATPSFYQQLPAAQAYGIQAQDYDAESIDMYGNTGPNTIFRRDGYWEYAFGDRNPTDHTINMISGRVINGSAVCKTYHVIDGGRGN
jgi:hypothetical protein